MKVLIAEKPSVGMELARITGCTVRRDGYMEGGQLGGEPCRVTWAVGHLVGITDSEDSASRHWIEDSLPVLPETFGLAPRQKDGKDDPGYVKQLRIIERLFASCDTIVNCGDAGREGELIQRYIFEYVSGRDPRCRKPVLRLWISSLTDEAIRKGLASLRPSSEFDALYRAGKSRDESDWLVGINATEALTLAARRNAPSDKRVYSLGRVQTPTMAMVCSRYLEHKGFHPETFFTVRLGTEKDGIRFHADSVERFKDKDEAEAVSASASTLMVVSSEKKPRTIKPPLLHDLTSLQQEASRRYGMDPDESLAVLQRLYEAKLVTYPRTGSRFIPDDVLATVPSRIRTIATVMEDTRLRAAAIGLSSVPAGELNRRSVNPGKVTDHHALLIETTRPSSLDGKEAKIYALVAARMLVAFSGSCECESVSIRLRCGGHLFGAAATRVLVPGWKAVLGETLQEKGKGGDDDEVEMEGILPELSDGETLPVKDAETRQGQTKPKPLYTMDSLLEAMKTAGRDSCDDEVKAALHEIGIGTPATRAAIIKTLVDTRRYIRKDGKCLVPTETGLEIYSLVKDMPLADVALTGRWEAALSQIAEGKGDPDRFDASIRSFTKDVTKQLLSISPGVALSASPSDEGIACPLCGGRFKLWRENGRCTNPSCGLYLSRKVYGKTLGEKTVRTLLGVGRTGIIKGLVSPRSGKTFDARLQLTILEKDGRKYANCTPVFDDRKPSIRKGGGGRR